MKNKLLTQKEPVNSDEILKTTTLIYFKEALDKQEYELCPELIKTAKGFGAKESEIRQVITLYLKELKGGRTLVLPRF